MGTPLFSASGLARHQGQTLSRLSHSDKPPGDDASPAFSEHKHLVILRTGSRGELSITGAIDCYNAHAVASAVAGELRTGAGGAAELSDAISGHGDLHLDLSKLEFTDVSGLRALVQVAENAGNNRRLVPRGLPPRIRMVMAAVGWGDLPNLVIEEPEGELPS